MKYKIKTSDDCLTVSVRCGPGESIAEDALRAFDDCRLPGFMKVRQCKGKRVTYIAAGAKPLKRLLDAPLSGFDFFMLVEQFIVSIRTLERKGLSAQAVLCSPERSFYAVNTKQLLLLYLPTKHTKNPALPIDFIEGLLQSVTPKTGDDSILCFAGFLRGLPDFDADAIERYIVREKPDILRFFGNTAEMPDVDTDATVRGEDDDRTVYGDASDITRTGPDDPTVYAPMMLTERPHLLRSSTGERITLSVDRLRIGSRAALTDYTICDNPTVSRKHADIFLESGCWYVRDLSSKNGTFLNGSALPPQKKMKLSDGDHLHLSNDEFTFHST